MGTIQRQVVHTYGTESLHEHIFQIQKLLAKILTREKEYFTVIFVGETHNTLDERRRAILFGFRPSSPKLLTVMERGMDVPAGLANVVVEPESNLKSSDPQRDTNVVGQIAAAYAQNRYDAALILFGEDHEKKIRERLEVHPGIPAMVWHFFSSFSDHTKQQQRIFTAQDPRGEGFTLMGMIRPVGRKKLDLQQLAEGILPTVPDYRIAIMSPFVKQPEESRYAAFARNALATGVQNSLAGERDAYAQITQANIRDLRVVDIQGQVRPVADYLKKDNSRREAIMEFWQDA